MGPEGCRAGACWGTGKPERFPEKKQGVGLEGSAVSRNFLVRPRRVWGVGFRRYFAQRQVPGERSRSTDRPEPLTSCKLSGV